MSKQSTTFRWNGYHCTIHSQCCEWILFVSFFYFYFYFYSYWCITVTKRITLDFLNTSIRTLSSKFRKFWLNSTQSKTHEKYFLFPIYFHLKIYINLIKPIAIVYKFIWTVTIANKKWMWFYFDKKKE